MTFVEFKKSIKKNKILKSIYELLFQRPIHNLFKRNYDKKVLFSYSTYHFNNKGYLAHSNYQESHVIANIFDSMGYQVDIINNDRPFCGDYSDYDVIFGEGFPLNGAALASKAKSVKRIFYGTGSHPWHCTNSSLKRDVEFFHQYKCSPVNSSRLLDFQWGLAASKADAVICIGNETTRNTFLENDAQYVYPVDPTFHQRSDSKDILKLKDMKSCRKTALWFGSYGLLHKGLDLAVEAFREKTDWTLHVCGYIEPEQDLISIIAPPENVIIHGFLDIQSSEFKILASNCGFVILPSCSEGTATAVLTAVGNGAMIPIVTAECGFDIEEFGLSIELNKHSIIETINEIENMYDEKLTEMATKAHTVVSTRYTLDNYEKTMTSHLHHILKNK